MLKNLPIYKLVLGEDDELGVNTVSFVDSPAIEINWVRLSKEEEKVQFSVTNPEKHIVTGPLLIPNKPIYRYDKKNNIEYYVTIDEDTIEKVANLFNKNMFNQKVDVMHNGQLIEDIYMIENWKVEDSKMDKSAIYGYSLDKGSWVASYKVDDIKFWDENIANNKLQGFSIDGLFLQQLLGKISIQNSEEKPKIDSQKIFNKLAFFILKNE